MLALHKLINLVGGWTYKSKHDLDKNSNIITSNRSTGTSSSNKSTGTSSSKGYHKKTRGIKNNKSKRGKGKGNKTKSRR